MIELPTANDAVKINYNEDIHGDDFKNIYKLADSIQVGEKPLKIADITVGSKLLILSVQKNREFITYVSLTEDAKTKDDTTICYVAALKIMQDIANKSGQEIIYSFASENTNLANWMRTKGNKIFEWESFFDDIQRNTIFAKSRIKPKDNL